MKPVTVKLTLEGPPDLVEAVSARVQQFFTVTYTSKDRPKRLSPTDIVRFLLVLPPGQAHLHTLPLTPGPGRETTDDPPSGGPGHPSPPSEGSSYPSPPSEGSSHPSPPFGGSGGT